MATREQLEREGSADIAASIFSEVPEFSLALGGPLFQLFRKSHLARAGLELLHRRLLAFLVICWLPLLLLSTLAPAIESKFSFLYDIEVQVRFLVALPVLIAAEMIVHLRLRPVVRAFVERRIVLPKDVPRFRDAVQAAVRLRNSVSLEICLLLLVYTVGLWLWRDRPAISVPTWYAKPGSPWNLTPAGFWYVFISIPIFQFILLRWYARFFIWYRFLWQVRRIDLNLIASHPDRCAGLAFIGKAASSFGPILFAQGATLAGLLGRRILYRSENLLALKFEILGFVLFFITAALGPLLMFTPRMDAAKRRGLLQYALLAQRYVEGFEQRWVADKDQHSNELLGSGDIQSLADLGNSYEVVKGMRIVPFGLEDIYRLAAATTAPLIPLVFTIFSPQELMVRILKFVF